MITVWMLLSSIRLLQFQCHTSHHRFYLLANVVLEVNLLPVVLRHRQKLEVGRNFILLEEPGWDEDILSSRRWKMRRINRGRRWRGFSADTSNILVIPFGLNLYSFFKSQNFKLALNIKSVGLGQSVSLFFNYCKWNMELLYQVSLTLFL